MKNVVAYCRVSTDKEDQLNSFEAQKAFFSEYTKRNDLNLIKIYADEGITGTSTKKRDEFNKMMSDSSSGIFDCILVKDVSRFARNTVDLLKSTRKLKANGVNVVFITGNMQTNESSEVILSIFGALAQEESANTSKRVKFGKRINAEKGKVPNFCYGYIKTKGDYFNLQINEQEAEIVREIFDLYVNQGYGTHKISKILNARGLKSLRGVNWTTTAVSRILKNKLYAGYVVNNVTEIEDFIEKTRRKKDKSEWIEIERPEFAIIPLELWERAQAVNESNNLEIAATLHKKRGNKYPFSTLITCAVCGYSFRRIRYKRVGYDRVFWSCSGRNHFGAASCNNMTVIPEEELIENIDKYFRTLVSDKRIFANEVLEHYKKHQPKSPTTALTAQLEKLRVLRNKQIAMFEGSIITITELKERTADIDKQIAQVELDLRQYESPEDAARKAKELYDRIEESIENYSTIGKMTNAELKTLIKSIVVDEKQNIRIELNY
ncbi:MAG: recombinase family protein [Ruminococcus sp.]|nr:recombinase family protein [Ruminococcus sp.]